MKDRARRGQYEPDNSCCPMAYASNVLSDLQFALEGKAFNELSS